MKAIETKGIFTENKSRPASFNISQRSELCLKHMMKMADHRFGDVPFVGATLGEDPPHLVHHRLDWTEVLPYSIYGSIIACFLTGAKVGEQIQLSQRDLMLGRFNKLDGLIYSPQSPWNESYPLCLWEQARALYTLIYWYRDSEEEQILQLADGIVSGLFNLSSQKGQIRIFPQKLIRQSGMGIYNPGTLIDPLTRYFELTGNLKAYILASGLTRFMLDPANGYFNGKHNIMVSFRTAAAVMNGLSKFASLSREPELITRVKCLHDQMAGKCTSFGSTPCTEPACTDMELNWSALSLIRLGYDEYWDQIDRFIRNQTAEAQFLDPSEWVREKALKGGRMNKSRWVTEQYPADLLKPPYDDYDQVVERCVGGFMWATAREHLFIPASVMLCCSSHALRSFEIIMENALQEKATGIFVNLHFNFENLIGEIVSYEPYLGKTVVIPKKDCDLYIRIPEHAINNKLALFESNQPVPIVKAGRYIYFKGARSGQEYRLEFPLNKRETVEKQSVLNHEQARFVGEEEYRVNWRGNTVISVLPESGEEKRIYKRKYLDTDHVPYEEIRHFIPEKQTLY